MDAATHVHELSKRFHVRTKQEGLAASLRAIARPTYREINAVNSITFSVEPGKVLAFIGPNGAGKSTTIKLITGILYPDADDISVLGLNLHQDRRRLAYEIGTVFGQKSQLWFNLPPADSFQLRGSVYDMPRAEVRARVEFLTKVFGIGDLLDQPVRKLSLGQRIRCEMVASLIHCPRILFLDEPSIGLDVVVKQRIRDLIGTVNREEGVPIFLTSHDAGDIEKICRRAMVINHGRIVWDGSVKEMKYSLLNRRVVDVKMDGPAAIEMPGVRVVKRKEYSLKIEVDPSAASTEEVITNLMRQSSIQDITISSTPMKEVISHIFQQSRETGRGFPHDVSGCGFQCEHCPALAADDEPTPARSRRHARCSGEGEQPLRRQILRQELYAIVDWEVDRRPGRYDSAAEQVTPVGTEAYPRTGFHRLRLELNAETLIAVCRSRDSDSLASVPVSADLVREALRCRSSRPRECVPTVQQSR